MKAAIFSFIQKHSLIKPGTTVIVGLSGGPDSVFLLHILNELKESLNIKLIAAYLDHGWRTDTQQDIDVCERLCTQLNIPLRVTHAHTLEFKPEKSGSLEDEGRALRRFYFNTLMTEYAASVIAVGHHQDDQIETFFIRLARGASLSGLGAMRARNGVYIRPLLETPKKAILTYLGEHQIPYTLDSTNKSDQFLRNRLRNHAIPVLEQCDNRMKANIVKSIIHLQEAYESVLTSLDQKTIAISSKCNYNDRIIDVSMLGKESPFFQKELVARWLIDNKVTCNLSKSFINEIVRFLCSPRGGIHQIHTSWRIVKKNNKAYITPS